MSTVAQRIVEKVAGRAGMNRRSFLRNVTLGGAALAVSPWNYITQPVSAYAAVCGAAAECANGWSVMCCTINAGQNQCPPNTFVGGWWKADRASFCGGAARYYVDCNAYSDNNTWPCRCSDDPHTCDHRRIGCNQFRYGQCSPDVPWSRTGPVVCRVVTCTPPWVLYGGTCSSTSLTDNRTVSHTAPCVSGREPFGSLDNVSAANRQVRISGWALDWDAWPHSGHVAVYSEAGGIAWFETNVQRDDVNAAFGVNGRHGFDIVFSASPGQHTYTVYAINHGVGGNPSLGSRTVVVGGGRSPVGALDGLTTSENTVSVSGWAFDPDDPDTSLAITAEVDGAPVATFTANGSRPDVNQAFSIAGGHGFVREFTAPNGDHRIVLRARDIGPATSDGVLVDRVVTVNPGTPPRGALDIVAGGSAEVRLAGWAYDPDDPTTEIKIAVYRDGVGLAWYPTGLPRPDVNQVFGIPGDHGFDLTLPAPAGNHSFDVYAINVLGGAFNPLIGRGTVSIDAVASGRLDQVRVIGGTVWAGGWVFDNARPAASIHVEIVVDGGPGMRVPTTTLRPDVNQEFGTSGRHGFGATVQPGQGTHTVAAYAVSVNGQKVAIGSRDVTVM